jgi:ribose/xylose/arabinose/galactoside ABC-type transport system permease subunit
MSTRLPRTEQASPPEEPAAPPAPRGFARWTASPLAAAARERKERAEHVLARWGLDRFVNWETLGLPLMTLLVAAVFWYLTPDFLTVSNLTNVARQVSILALVAAGQTVVILSAGIDLSVGSVVALVSVFAAMGLKDHGVAGFIVYGVAFGVAAGLINGLLIGKARIAAFIATLGMLSMARGLALSATNGVPVFGLPDSGIYQIGNGYVGPIPAPVIFAVAGFAATWVLLYRTRFGTYVYAIGDNEESAKLAGINVPRVKVLIYTWTGLLAAVGGLVLTARVRSGQPLLGEGLELQAIAAVVIGGVSLFGGRGRLSGTIWGVILIGILSNGLNLVGVSTFVQQIVIGAVIVLAVGVATALQRHKE